MVNPPPASFDLVLAVDFGKVDRLAKLGLGIRGHVPLSSEWPGGVLTLVRGRKTMRREQAEMP